ncbi:MAG: hypothetical protein M1817_000906 [Caeruleum heppii]|nr:MAG: hypothetical protein M1817_000906 [Caeruleum heppii]
MAMRRSRAVAIILSALSVISTAVLAYLFRQLPDDTYHLALACAAYSYFGSLLSVFGLLGAIREHSFSVALFANFFIIDTIVCAVPRFLLLTLLPGFGQVICESAAALELQRARLLPVASADQANSETSLASTYSREACMRLAWTLQTVLAIGIVATTFVQLIFAFQIREYAGKLLLRDYSSIDQQTLAKGRRMERLFTDEEEAKVRKGTQWQ